MKTIKQKLLILLLIVLLVGRSIVPSIAVAEEAATETTSTTTQPAEPTPTERIRENDSSRRRAEVEAQRAAEAAAAQQAAQQSQTATNSDPVADPTVTPQSSTGQQTDDGNGSAPEVITGDATTNGAIANNANSNISAGGNGGNSGTSVSNTNNGAGSTNNGSATTSSDSDTNQVNNATINNNATLGAETGNNSASENYGGAEIKTGDANVSGTIVNSVNTNVDGIAVAEFNVVDDHVGDIILDFGDINCVSNCGGANNIAANNSGNGANSSNTAQVVDSTTNDTYQENNAGITNDMTLTAVSGGNNADDNIGGDVSIKTGDANASANILNFVNNNIAGNVIYGVVNIFGDLIGDILLPENPFANCSSCMANDITATNSGNGANSTNNSDIALYDYDNTFQYNDADIDNGIVIDANTGSNDTSDNIGGDKEIITGNTNVNAQVLNIANSNIIGENWWLVIVNEAGNWVGKIMGAPEGANYAGSYGTEFAVDENGNITAMNNANLAGSDNNSSVNSTNTNNTTQINNADIDNNINIVADTGNNSASRNGSGDVSIVTGDVNVAANIVNFVNNNIVGNGKLFVTMINVFGSWMGDVVTPGQQKATQTAQNNAPVGGQEAQNTNNNNNSNNSANNSSSQSNSTLSVVGSETGENTFEQTNSGFGTVKGEKTPKGPNSDATVASIVGQDDSAAVAEKKINVNLAWLLLALPGIVLIKLFRKSFVPVKTLALKGIHLFL